MPDWGNRERVSESLTADRLQEIERSQAELADIWSSQQERDSPPGAAAQPSAEEIVGKALLSAQRTADMIVERAREEAARLAAEAGREASPILASAHRTLEEAKTLYREAQMTLEQARLQAAAIVEAAQVERQQLIADSVSAASQRRVELDDENRRLGKAIHDLRAEWVSRASDALARLDRIAALAGSTAEEQPLRGAIGEQSLTVSLPEPVDRAATTAFEARTFEASAFETRRFDPGTADRGTVEPSTGEVSNGAASNAEHRPGEPSVSEPSAGNPGVGEPGADDPGVGAPGVGDPGVGEPGVGEPSVAADLHARLPENGTGPLTPTRTDAIEGSGWQGPRRDGGTEASPPEPAQATPEEPRESDRRSRDRWGPDRRATPRGSEAPWRPGDRFPAPADEGEHRDAEPESRGGRWRRRLSEGPDTSGSSSDDFRP
jgi:hypothetical protein